MNANSATFLKSDLFENLFPKKIVNHWHGQFFDVE